ncbi:MAG: hypothetical protein HC894_01420 [Microcoleus sp. SM1_3_4]|nr:hypothetical protein [Microcoleus sp. SM1_3_4]
MGIFAGDRNNSQTYSNGDRTPNSTLASHSPSQIFNLKSQIALPLGMVTDT